MFALLRPTVTAVLRKPRRHVGCLPRFWLKLIVLLAAGWQTIPVPTATGALPPFVWSFDVTKGKLGFAPSGRMGLFRESDAITITTSTGATIRVLALDGTLVYQGAPLTRTYTRGHYFVETSSGDRNQFAVLPNDLGPLPMAGVHDTGSWNYGDQLKAAWQPTWERTGHGQWSVVQPTAGTWNWAKMDAALLALSGTGRKIIYLGAGGVPGIPSWVSPGSSYAAYTNNIINAYTNFVTAALQRYGTQIYGFEVFNEPMQATLGVTNDLQVASLFLTMAQAVKTVRDRVAPGVKLVGPSWQGALTGNTQYLVDNGISNIIDVWCWHDYDEGYAAPDQDHALRPSLCHRLQEAFGPVLLAKTTVVDELAVYGRSALGCPAPTDPIGTTNSGIDWYRGYCRAAKTVLMYGAAGVDGLIPHVGGAFAQYPASNIELYGFDYGPADTMVPRGPHPKTSAFLMAAYWLRNATLVDYRTPGRAMFLYAWQAPNNTALVFAWSLENTTNTINRALAPTSTDLFGRANAPAQLTEQPIIFQSTTLTPAALLAGVMTALPSTNLAPVCAAIDNQSVLRDQLLQLDVPGTDPDHDPITYTVNPLPAGATLNSATGRFSWTPTIAQLGRYTLTFTVTDARGLSASTTTVIDVLGSATDGLVGHWKLDDGSGTTALDAAGTNAGKLTNFVFGAGSGWVAGRLGGALQFDAVNDSVTLASSNAALALTNNFTFAAWINPLNAAGEGVVFANRFQYTKSGFRIWVAANAVRIEGQTTTGWHGNKFALNSLQNSTWYHLVVVDDKSTLKVYVNGVLQDIAYYADPNWGGDFIANTTGTSALGSEGDGMYFFKGTIDDVRLYRRTLTPSEILALSQGAVNQAPVLAAIGNKSVTAGQTLGFTVAATDPDSATLTYSATGLPSGASFNPSTRAFAWTPTASQAGGYTVTFTVSDGSLTDSETITITVASPNLPPKMTANGNQTIAAGQTLSFTVVATDPNGDPLTYTALNLPSGATFNTGTHVFTWTPAANQVGVFNVSFEVSDGALKDGQTVAITVTAGSPVNQPPVLATIGNKSVTAGQTLGFTVAATDPDSATLTYSATGLPSGASFNPSTRAFAWTPTASQAGGYTVTFTVSDGSLTDSETITITVASPNLPPKMTANGNQTIAAGQTLSFTVVATDPNGDPLTYTALNLPSGATFNTGTHVFTWTPAANQVGVFNVSFEVSDGSLKDGQNVAITVTAGAPVNQPPVLAAIGNKSVNEGSPLIFTVAATDVDSSNLIYSASSLPSGATFAASTRTFSWTPTYAQAGNYNVTFTVSDGTLTDSETITITVNNVNQPPVLAAIGNKSVSENALLSFTVSATDADGGTLTYSATGLPSGAAFNASTRTFSWTPTYAQAGSYPVTFAVSDGSTNDTETITVTVNNVNQPPVLATIGSQTVAVGQSLSLTVTATDPDGDGLTYAATGLPAGSSFNAATRVFTWTPASNQLGTHNITCSVSDGVLTDSEIVPITVVMPRVNRLVLLEARTGAEVGTLTNGAVLATGALPAALAIRAETLPATVGSVWFILDTSVIDLVDNDAPYSLLGDDTVTYTPWTPTVGAHQLSATPHLAADAQGLAGTAITVSFSVVNTLSGNSAPVLTPPALVATVAGTACTATLGATDANNDPLSWFATGLPAGATFNTSTRVFAWTPAAAQAGAYVPTVTVADGKQSDTEMLPVLVAEPGFNFLAGATLVSSTVLSNRVFVACWREADSSTIVAAWCRPGAVATIGATAGLTRTDLANNPVNTSTLGPDPILFHNSKKTPSSQTFDTVVNAIVP